MVVRAPLPSRLSSAKLSLERLADEVYSITLDIQLWIKRVVLELDAAVAKALQTLTGTVGISNSAAPSVGQALVATSQNTAIWRSGLDSEFSLNPVSPGTLDDEFLGTTLNPAWVIRDNAGVTLTPDTVVDPYVSFAAGVPKAQVGRTAWTSWLQLQAPSNALGHSITKTATLPTDIFVWCRVGVQRRAVVNAVAGRIQLALFISTAGVPDFNNKIQIGYDTGPAQLTFVITTGGVNAFIGISGAMNLAQGTVLEYWGVQKIGTTYHGWAFSTDHSCHYLGSGIFAGTIAFAGFLFLDENIAVAIPGNAMHNIDFIRSVDGASYLP